ncbi:MAG TPA: hypothetical protein VFQ23_06200 [Anaerolineales bacterium]|nr:hypothetical protein [Anaerolineales bacterium]
MNKTVSTTLIVFSVLVLAVIIFFAGSMYARMNSFGPGNMMSGYDWENGNAFGPSMMNGRGPNMMGGFGYNSNNFTPLTIDQTKTAAEKYLTNLNNSDLQIAEVMIFDNNGYVMVEEASTGIGAFELLVDPVSQTAYPEHGPNMMWNLKYSSINHDNMMGNHGGMMGWMMSGNGNMMQGWSSSTPLNVTAEMTVTPEQAIKYAQKFLDANNSGATATTGPVQFYGYYTLDFEKDGKVAGMLSINGYSGQVFLHTWHGTFIEETEYE